MDIQLLRGAEILSLTDNTVCGVLSWDGVGEAPVRRIEERGPQQHGVSDVGFRLEPREIQLALWLGADSFVDLEARRRTLVDWLRATTANLTLRFTTEAGEIFDIDGHSVGALTLPVEGGDGMTLKSGVVFRCPDPTFYDPVAVAVSFLVGGGADSFYVPMSVPHFVGASVVNASVTVTYAGTWRAYPLIRIVGPIADPVITNAATGEVLDFTGTTIAGGDRYDIDLRYGHKTVIDAAGVSQIAKLVTSSDLATWHIADDSEVTGEVTGGVNSISVTGSGANVATRIDIVYNTRYVGI
jgi:hypothetical protein